MKKLLSTILIVAILVSVNPTLVFAVDNTHSGDYTVGGDNHTAIASVLGITAVPISIALWTKSNGSADTNHRYYVHLNNESGAAHLSRAIRYDPVGTKIWLDMGDGVGGTSIGYVVDLDTTPAWHNIWATVDSSGNGILYFDGVSVATGTHTVQDGGFSGGSAFEIGGGSSNQENYAFHDEVQIYDTNISAATIADAYNYPSTISASTANLRAYYQYESDTTSDSTSNNYDLGKTGTVDQTTDVPFASNSSPPAASSPIRLEDFFIWFE